MRLLPKDPVKTLVNIAYIIIAFLCVFVVLPTLARYIAPFIVAVIISMVITPIVNFMCNKLHIPRKVSTIASILLILTILGLFLFNLVYQAVYFLQSFALEIPEMLSKEYPVPGWIDTLRDYIIRFPAPMQDFIDNIRDNLVVNISELISPATTATINVARSIAAAFPTILIFSVVTILATYFLSYDNKVIASVAERFLGTERVNKTIMVRDRLFQACGAYIRAQLIMMCIIFVVVLIGMLILRVESPLFVAFITAVVDAIPILGTGTVLIPWALVSLIMGNYGRAVGLAILYVCALTTRQFFEPKVVSSQIGLHPLITLMSMYVGLTAIGIFGMILGPIVTIVVLKFVEIERESKKEKV